VLAETSSYNHFTTSVNKHDRLDNKRWYCHRQRRNLRLQNTENNILFETEVKKKKKIVEALELVK
jgi:hypothetical protein